MKKKVTNLPASVLARLKHIAEKEHLDFNFLLLRYLQERFLARIADSGFVNMFILKGGFLLLAYNIERARPTRDMDFLGVDMPADRKELERVVRMICSVELSDGVVFHAHSMKSATIKEQAEYAGIRIKLIATISSARNTLQLDVGFGDVLTPCALQMEYPTLLTKERIKVLAYSKETIVAEKFEAIVRLTTFNTRMKDFYDIVFLARERDFDGAVLQTALRNTFTRRQTEFSSALELLNSGLGAQATFQRHWDAFKRRTRIHNDETFFETFAAIRSFLTPIVGAEIASTTTDLHWSRSNRKWL